MFYDHIALITTNPDGIFQQQKTAEIARSIGVQQDDITVHYFERHPEGAYKGCFTSHHSVWNMVVNSGFERTLVLEDDVVFLKPVHSDTFAGFLNATPDWEIFYLGHRPIIWDKRMVQQTAHKGIVQVQTNDTHAYIISKKGAERLSAIRWRGKPVDIVLSDAVHNYALFPMRAIQCGRFFTDSFFNGMSERNSQYIRYALQKPVRPLRAVGYLLFVVVVQPWIFLSSTWLCFRRTHP